MPLHIDLRPGDVLHIDEKIRIQWDPKPRRKGRLIRLIVNGKGYDVRLKKRAKNGSRPVDDHGDVDGNR